jgi:hypothetical protein
MAASSQDRSATEKCNLKFCLPEKATVYGHAQTVRIVN